MLFQKRHYKIISELLNELAVSEVKTLPPEGKLSHLSYHAETLIDCLCDIFKQDNPNFNKHKFIEACGFEPWDTIIMGRPFMKEELDRNT